MLFLMASSNFIGMLNTNNQERFFLQGVPEKLCPVCLKIATKRQKILTNLFHDVALQMFN